jgi:hypothetical protein
VAPTSGWPGSAGARWVVERTLGWLLSYKRLALRYDRTALSITALARLAVTRICPTPTEELMQRLLRTARALTAALPVPAAGR